MKKLLLPLLLISLIACKKEVNKPVDNKVDSTAQERSDSTNTTNQSTASKAEVLKKVNDEILQVLKNKNYKKLAEYIHPEKGVRFSMYAFVNPKEDKTFSKADFEKYQPTKNIFIWGVHDGSGDLYKETINDYLGKWVFSKDFTTAQFSLDKFQGEGNSLNNLEKVYPKNSFTENYIKGSEKNGEMDWKTLRFVFEEFQGKYYLVGVINDQWTI